MNLIFGIRNWTGRFGGQERLEQRMTRGDKPGDVSVTRGTTESLYGLSG